MKIKVIFEDKEPFEKEMEPDGIWLDLNEPPPDGKGVVVGLEIEGLVSKRFAPIMKLPNLTLSVSYDSLSELRRMLEEEKVLLNTELENLPLIINDIQTDTGKIELERRLKGEIT